MKKLLTIFAMTALGFGTAFGQPPPPGGGTVDYQITFTSGTYDSEVSWELVPSAGGVPVASADCGTFDPAAVVNVTLNEGTSYDFVASDDWGDGWNGATYTIAELPCVVAIHTESPDDGVAGDGALSCTVLNLESTFTFTAAVACPSCLDPSNVMATNVGPNDATISWSGAADMWGIEYMNGGSLVQVAPATNPITISGLMPETSYTVNVQGICGLDGTAVDSVVFTTGMAATANDACPDAMMIPTGNDTTMVMNGNYMDGPTITCSVGAEDDAWFKFMGTGTPLLIYGSVQGPDTDFAMEVWQGCPSEGGALLLCDDDGNDVPSSLMPLAAICSQAGVMYYVRYWEYSTSTPGMMAGFTVKQAKPTITSASNRSNHGMTINFDAPVQADNFIIRYHELGDVPNYSWKTLLGTASSGYVNGLMANTQYVFRVGPKCTGGNAAYSDTTSFWTRPNPCGVPDSLSVLFDGDAYFSWNDVGANFYKMRYRMMGDTIWTYVNQPQSFVMVSGLAPGTMYQWQVRAVCNVGGNQGYGNMATFTTPSVRLAAQNVVTDLNVYPNPTEGALYIEFVSEATEMITINVLDIAGKVVFTSAATANEGSNRINLDLSNLKPGSYMTTLSNADGFTQRLKVTVQ